MGKRKSKAKPPPKKRMDKLDTVFSCPFCSHGTSVECRIDMKNAIGEAICNICQESFSTTVTAGFGADGILPVLSLAFAFALPFTVRLVSGGNSALSLPICFCKSATDGLFTFPFGLFLPSTSFSSNLYKAHVS
nr:transcription elongation factor 1 homolog [Ipomoea trifida]